MDSSVAFRHDSITAVAWGIEMPLGMHACVLTCILSHFSSVWLFATLWTVVHQASLSLGFSRQKYWCWLPCLHLGDLPNPGMQPRSPALQVDCLPAELPEKPIKGISGLPGWLCIVPVMQKTQVQSLSQEDPLEEAMATHSSILAWRISTDRGA